jgi:hypothetical protein
MKKITFITLAVILLFQAKSQSVSQSVLTDFKKLDWLEGVWTGKPSRAGQSTQEHWIKYSPQEYRGYGVTLQGTDTVSFEKFALLIKDENLFFVADVPENKKLVYFKLTEITSEGFTCENPDHDFPKKIVYHREGNKIKASISGDGKIIDFYFERDTAVKK